MLNPSLAALARSYDYFGIPVANNGYERVNYTLQSTQKKRPRRKSPLSLCQGINSSLLHQGINLSTKTRDFFAEFSAGNINCEMACFLFTSIAQAIKVPPLALQLFINPRSTHLAIRAPELNGLHYWETTCPLNPIISSNEYEKLFPFSTTIPPNTAADLGKSILLALLEETSHPQYQHLLKTLIKGNNSYPNLTLLTLKQINLLQKNFDQLNNPKSQRDTKIKARLLKLATQILKLYRKLPDVLRNTNEAKVNIDFFNSITK